MIENHLICFQPFLSMSEQVVGDTNMYRLNTRSSKNAHVSFSSMYVCHLASFVTYQDLVLGESCLLDSFLLDDVTIKLFFFCLRLRPI